MACTWLSRCVALVWLVVFATTTVAQDDTMSLQDLRNKRHALAHRPRRIIMNNDGCDVLYFPSSEETTVENFLAKRTTALAGVSGNKERSVTITTLKRAI